MDIVSRNNPIMSGVKSGVPKLPLEIWRMILEEAVAVRTVRRALRLRLVNSEYASSLWVLVEAKYY